MSYLVRAPLVLVRVPRHGDGDRIDYHYAGSVIPALTAAQEQQFLSEGLVEKVDIAPAAAASRPATPPPATPQPATPPAPSTPAAAKPAKTAPEEAWRAYAATQPGVSAEDVAKLSKQDLIDLYGG